MNIFVRDVAAVSKKTVVLTQIPGPTLMDWRVHADAVLTMFLGGDQTGSAWAAVLFGDHSPTGKLPVTIPDKESDTIKWGKGDVHYSEGMATSYRNAAMVAAYPFGHGLSYTSFEYGTPVSDNCNDELCIRMQVSNTGLMEAKTVVQLYLEFPKAAQHPVPFLKGFEKTDSIAPGKSAEVVFVLRERQSLSYWRNGSWKRAASATAYIGASSQDILQTLVLNSTYPPSKTTTTTTKTATTTTTAATTTTVSPTPSPTPPSPPTPSPHGCPGGTLVACLKQCPADPDAFKLCVEYCEENCDGPAPTPSPPPAPVPSPVPTPSDCPGGNLSTCLDLCSSSGAAIAICEDECQKRCPSGIFV